MSRGGSENSAPEPENKRGGGSGRPRTSIPWIDQFTMFLRFLSGMTRTFLLAGFALNIIF